MVPRTVRSLAIFLVLAYAITWTCFITVAVAVPARTLPGQALILTGAFSPALAALLVAWWRGGPGAVRRLLSALARWRVGLGWFAIAATFTVALKLAAAVVHRMTFGAWPRFGTEPAGVIVLAMAASWPFQAGEELGWRGFALPRLAGRFGLPGASLALGAIWACWHLPQFYIEGGDTFHQSFVVFLLGVIALSVLLAWAYDRTGGSLPIVMLMHAAYNNSKDIVPSASPSAPGVFSLAASRIAWITVGLLWVCAALCLADMRRRSRPRGWILSELEPSEPIPNVPRS